MIEFGLTYMKPGSGKYYAGSKHWANNLEDAVREVRQLRERKRLPGLAPGHSDFGVIVETPDGLPHLVTVDPVVVSVTKAHLEELKHQAEHYPRVAGLNIRLQELLRRWVENANAQMGFDYLMSETRKALGELQDRDVKAGLEAHNR